MKTCSKCRQRLPLSAFHKMASRKDGLHPWCKQCNCAHVRAWRRNDPRNALGSDRRKKGWAPGEHEKAEAALAAVKSCECCYSPEPRTKHGWMADHDHLTGLFRGILCHPCNIRIGLSEKFGLEFTAQEKRYLEIA